MKDFLVNVVKRLPVTTMGLRVAAVTFANRGTIRFDFDDYTDQDSLQEKISNFPFGGGLTNTTGALRVARTELFKATRGDRSLIKNVVILLSDGNTTLEANGLEAEAAAIRQTGAELFVIGITNGTNKDQLMKLVTPPKENHYFQVSEFNFLMRALHFVISGACLNVTLPPPTTTTSEPFVPCTAADIALLVDNSGSIQDMGEQNWQIVKNFLKAVVERLGISDRGTHVAAITFSNRARIEFRFLGNEDEVLNQINNLNYEGGFTNTTGALRLARTTLFTGTYGARPQSQDIIIVITDGVTNKELAQLPAEITNVKNTGARILAIGVTNATNEQQLLMMVSEPQYYQRVENFAELISSLESVIKNTGNCEPVTQPPSFQNLNQSMVAATWGLSQSIGISDRIKFDTKLVDYGSNWNLHQDCYEIPNTGYYFIHWTAASAAAQTTHMQIQGVRYEVGLVNRDTIHTTIQVCNADLILLVDSSGSIEDKGKDNWNLIKNFLKSVVDALVVGPQATHIAAITFSNNAFYEFGFLNDSAKIKAGIDTLNYEGGFTNTTGALRLSRTKLFTTAEGDRPDSPNLIMIITDGNTTREAKLLLDEAQRNRNNGVIIMAIGVTNDIDEAQLLAIVSNQQYYHRVEDFTGLLDALDSILSSDKCESAINKPGSTGRR